MALEPPYLLYIQEPNSIPTKILHLVQDQIPKNHATICN